MTPCWRLASSCHSWRYMCKHLQHKAAPDGNFYQVLENVSERVGKAEAAQDGELLSSETYWCGLAAKISPLRSSLTSPLAHLSFRLPRVWFSVQLCQTGLTVTMTRKLAWSVCASEVSCLFTIDENPGVNSLYGLLFWKAADVKNNPGKL